MHRDNRRSRVLGVLAACGESLVRLRAGICGAFAVPKGSAAWPPLRHGARSMMDTACVRACSGASPSRTARHICSPRRSNSATREFHHRLLGGIVFVMLLCWPAGAQDFTVGNTAALNQLNEHFGLAVYPYARRGAQPLGIVGIEVYAELAVDEDLNGQPYGSLVDSLPGDLLLPIRVGIRKGLPGGFDVGASYAQVLDLDFTAFSVDLQKAIFKPGALKPGLALRLAYLDGDSGSVYSLEQLGAELIVSKGFTLVSVFGGAGLIRSEGTFRFAGIGSGEFETSSTDTVLFAGVRVNLLLPKITFAVEKTEGLQGVLRIAFGW